MIQVPFIKEKIVGTETKIFFNQNAIASFISILTATIRNRQKGYHDTKQCSSTPTLCSISMSALGISQSPGVGLQPTASWPRDQSAACYQNRTVSKVGEQRKSTF
ncbi:hypothetical protein KIL84_003798 [Mauremys mutica]|uniref:Uncharacterized protein n=1 Tax=Mauremys mutica TaxID=74926 RepID=A0A9D4ATU8_9SAUR|nr:hypothetical protein KIL84_003798 [Mauremys mutica]